MDKILGAQPLAVPVMLVHGLWDQEDIYGAVAVYKAIEPKDKNNDKVFLVMGPWHHGQQIREGSKLGAIKFDSDTALYFRREILRPFLDQYLKDNAPKADVAPVITFETGTNTWRSLPNWPAGCTSWMYVESNASFFSTPDSSSTLALQKQAIQNSKNIFLIPRSRFRIVRVQFKLLDMMMECRGGNGSWTTNVKLRVVLMCWCLPLIL